MRTLKVAVVALALAVASSAMAQGFTPESLAVGFAKKDEERGNKASEARLLQLRDMTQRASTQCYNNIERGKEAENVGNMVVKTRQMLDEAGIQVSHYELMDVLNSMLGDGKPDWDCAAVLGLYMTMREKDSTHIGAYKVVQSMRDSGMIGAKK
jgi:hypothetical protein